jgi:hexosaminidase
VFDDTVIQIWKGDVNKTWEMYMNNITKDGYKVILSSPWYLNYIKYGNYLMIIIAI